VRDITVVKAPLQTPTPVQDGLFGFGPNQASQNFTNTPVSGVFSARLRYSYGPPQSTPLNPEINAYIFRQPVSLKVRQDAKNFIDNGKTWHIIIDGQNYFLDSESAEQSFLNAPYFVYTLKITK
jgi:hypothetical protein